MTCYNNDMYLSKILEYFVAAQMSQGTSLRYLLKPCRCEISFSSTRHSLT